MSRLASAGLAVLAAALLSEMLPSPASAADAPSARVVAMYFHRTTRCPTCRKMGSYSEEAVKTGFPEQLKSGTVEFHDIDFQDRKNAALTKGYGVSGPSLIVAKVEDGKVKEFENLQDIWTHAGEKAAFIRYVQENVAARLK